MTIMIIEHIKFVISTITRTNGTQGLKTRHMLFLAFLFRHILQFICFKILFTKFKYLFSNQSYANLIRTIVTREKIEKSLRVFKTTKLFMSSKDLAAIS